VNTQRDGGKRSSKVAGASKPAVAAGAAVGQRAQQALARREQLLDVAEALFVKHGYGGTSTKRIAQVAGVAEALVFHHFGSKDALLLALFARRGSFAGEVASLVLDPSPRTARELFASIASVYAKVSPAEAAFVAFASAEALVHPELARMIGEGTSQMTAHLVRVLEARRGAGELREAASLEATVLGFFGGFSFFFQQNRDISERTWKQRAARFASAWAEQCWRGIASEKALGEVSS
jgi:AcrR family transcriptional regulator